ncbi:hypothetical protein HK098_001809 [Nowakowskiella sp. JEL0407]|nr:hypothetical protein HK098_001809 [Nowakowskiella sp. JEL0407]
MEGTTNWWHQILIAYSSPDRVQSDCLNVLSLFPGLSTRSTQSSPESAQASSMLTISGTIPISFHTSTYNIPIEVIIPNQYPNEPPLTFVRPTRDMIIKQSKFVDVTGKIFHPYLYYWRSKPESTMLEFLRILQEIFSKEPPVYARPANSTLPPMPQQPPQYNSHYKSPPPIPAPPPRPNQISPSNERNISNSPVLPSKALSNPSNPSISPKINYSPSLASKDLMPSSNPKPSKLAETRNLVLQKLHSEISKFNVSSNQIDVILNSTRELDHGEVQINEVIRGLRNEEQKISNNISILKAKNEELSESITNLKNMPDVNIDDAIAPSTVVHKQLLDLIAEDHAIDDTQLVLFDALGRQDVDLTVYLKNLRMLARDQFMKRALIQKIKTQI